MALRRQNLCLVLVIAIILLSGCTVLDNSAGTPPATTGEGEIGPPLARITIHHPSANINPTFNRSGFYYDGRIVAQFYPRRGNVSFHDVRLCLYDESWNVIDSRSLGKFTNGSQAVHVDVHTAETPEWVIVEHPGFADLPLQGGALRNGEDGYAIVDWNDVPGPPLREPGQCR